MTADKRPKILCIEDDAATREIFKDGLESYGYDVEVAECGKAGVEKFCLNGYHAVVSDLKLPDIDGIEVLQAVRQADASSIVLLVTGFASVDTAVEALEQGAFDYFVKPVNFRHLDIVIRRALAQRQLQWAAPAGPLEGLCELIGSSSKMNRIYAQICSLARNDLTVLVLGETGTGKEMVARAIHQLSDRSDDPFIAVNCGSLSESLLKSELFGHVKGAFTGAVSDKRGLFDAAEGGTILLDEIESASPHTQVALLRVLDRKEVRPIGGTTSTNVNVRVLVASNKDLESLVSTGEFREDLFYRLVSSVVTLPPLRERVGDIPALADHFIEERVAREGKLHRKLSPRALELMMEYPWPGNVRELKHLVQQSVISSQRTIIRPADLPAWIKKASTKGALPSLADAERQLVERVLQVTNWNKSEAARVLGVPRSTVYSLIVKHGFGASH